MCNKQDLTILAERSINHWLAAGLGSGWLPKAPGTWGSLAALLPAWLIVSWGGVAGLLAASAIVLIIGCYVCAIVLPNMQDKDPGWIVIDEWAGQWLCLGLLIPVIGDGIVSYLVAFVAFRVFDIFKPWPVSLSETLGPPWWSIMADDVVAGLMGAAAVCLLFMIAVMAGF